MQSYTTLALLLKQTPLANDDMVLDFFTREHGRVSVFARKFARSQKKRQQLDFFRIVEIVFAENRSGNKSLQKVETQTVFHNFSHNFTTLEKGFHLLEQTRTFLAEEKTDTVFFDQFVTMLKNFSEENQILWRVFFWTQLLNFAGILPHFEDYESDVYLDTESHTLSEKNFKGWNVIHIKHTDRKILTFVRENSFEELLKHKGGIPVKNLERIEQLLEKIKH